MSFLGQLWLPEGQPRRKQVEAVLLCRRVLAAWMRHTQTTLVPEDHEEALEYLVTTSWQLSRRFDSRRGVAVDAYLYGILIRRVNDWLRIDQGRTKWTWSSHVYERARVVAPLSLDAPSGGEDARILGELVASPDRGGEADSEQTLGWLESTRSSSRAGDLRVLREWLCEEDEAGTESLTEEAA